MLSVFFAVPRKIESLVPWLSHVREAGSHVTLLSEHILHRPCSTFNTLIIPFLCYKLLINILKALWVHMLNFRESIAFLVISHCSPSYVYLIIVSSQTAAVLHKLAFLVEIKILVEMLSNLLNLASCHSYSYICTCLHACLFLGKSM